MRLCKIVQEENGKESVRTADIKYRDIINIQDEMR